MVHEVPLSLFEEDILEVMAGQFGPYMRAIPETVDAAVIPAVT